MGSGRRGHNEGSIYQRANGRWVAALSLNGGHRKSWTGKSRRQVQERLNEALHAQQHGALVSGSNPTVSQYLNRWMEDMIQPSVRPRTYEVYALNCRRLTPHLGHLRLATLGPAHVQACYSALLAGGLSRRSVEQTHAVLHRALRQAVQWDLVGRNATDAVSVPRPARREMRTLDAEQVQHLFETSRDGPGARWHALWVLLATTGLRLGEATGLMWSDIDFGAGTLTVKRALQRQRGAGLVLVEPKTQRSRRTVHLARGTMETLREHHRLQMEAKLAAGSRWQDRHLTFCTVWGGPLDPGHINQQFHKALTRAGLPALRPHDLRHTAATLLLQRGVHPKVVQELLGHSTITLTLDTYSHVAPALHAEVASHMNALFTTVASTISASGG
jgi:integrase